MPKSVIRAMQILECLGVNEDGLTHSQISRTLNIPKSTVSGVLRDLVSLDFVSLDPMTKRYLLGPRIISLAHNYLEGLDLIKIGSPLVKELSKVTGESVAIYVSGGMEALLICKQDSPQPVSRLLKVGARAPMYAIAAGKVLLAYMPDKMIDRYLSLVHMKPFTQHTLTDPNRLKEELEKIRIEAIAHNYEEYEEGVIAAAAPVFDMSGKVIAALCVVAPGFRVNKRRMHFIESKVREKSAEFSHRLGFQAGRDHFSWNKID